MRIRLVPGLFLTFSLALGSVQCCFGEKTISELEHSRISLISKEEVLAKAKESVKQRIDRMRAALDAQEKRLNSINLHLDSVRQQIVETDQALREMRK